MATYQCVKCGATFEKPEVDKNPKPENRPPTEESKVEKCCPSCAELGDLCKDYEEEKADRYD